MNKVTFSGKEYEFDGVNVYRDGVKVNSEPIVVVGSIKEVVALLVDNRIFYNNHFYSRD